MKRQWLGDDHDVRKYCLLKYIYQTLDNIPIIINWMITEEESQKEQQIAFENNLCDNNSILILANDISDYKHKHDTRHFDGIITILKNHKIEITPFSNKLPNITNVIANNQSMKQRNQRDICKQLRKNWLLKFIETIKRDSIVFFDPNNGLEIPSLKKSVTRIKSDNYIFCEEILSTLNNGHVKGVFVYQHALLFGEGTRQEEAIKTRVGQIKTAIAEKTKLGEKTDSNINGLSIFVFLGAENNDIKESYILLIKPDYSGKIPQDLSLKINEYKISTFSVEIFQNGTWKCLTQ